MTELQLSSHEPRLLFANRDRTWAVVVPACSLADGGIPIVPFDYTGEDEDAEYIGCLADQEFPLGEIDLKVYSLPSPPVLRFHEVSTR